VAKAKKPRVKTTPTVMSRRAIKSKPKAGTARS